MISLHLQNSTPRWPLVANTKADGGAGHGKVTKMLFGAERAAEVTEGLAWYRWVGDQPLPHDNFEDHCERWLRQFVDDTFIQNTARHVDLLNEYNETLANSQKPEEVERWKKLHTAMAKVWMERFRNNPDYPNLKNIRLVLAETAVGNDIHLAIARAADKYDALIGYHPYIACNDKAPSVPDNEWSGVNRPSYVSPHDWRWYSGRWNWMDKFFTDNGVYITWAFGEMGPVLDASGNWSGWLDPIGGWKSCLGGSINKYMRVMDYWLDNATKTDAYHQDRIAGGVLFTTGAPQKGQWDTFELRDDDLARVIAHTNAYKYPKKTGGAPPPPPPKPPKPEPPAPPPATPEPTCEPRVDYRRLYRVLPQDTSYHEWMAVCSQAYKNRETVGFSYDDAGIGKLSNKTAVLYNIDNEAEFNAWYAEHYPGTKLETAKMNGPQLEPFLQRPVEAPISQRFGDNYMDYMQAFRTPGHMGVDFAVPVGTPVRASAPGAIRKAHDPNGFGYYAVIDHGNGAQTIYGHMVEFVSAMSIGGEVATGEVIGHSGSSGKSTGPHLHWELRVDRVSLDPMRYLL